MKVEELYLQENQNQVGVTLQRVPFQTEVDIYPCLNPLVEAGTGRSGDDPVMSDLTSAQTEERVCQIVKHQKHQTGEGDEEFLTIPLKRIDSGPHQHHMQERCDQAVGTEASPEVDLTACSSRHVDLLEEMDNNCDDEVYKSEVKPQKKSSTLKRMLKGMRGEKEGSQEKLNMSKIFQKINPVSKNSRDGLSKVFHRIGDALQKKAEDERGGTPSGVEKQKSLERNLMSEGKIGGNKLGTIGERLFNFRSSDSDPDKTT